MSWTIALLLNLPGEESAVYCDVMMQPAADLPVTGYQKNFLEMELITYFLPNLCRSFELTRYNVAFFVSANVWLNRKSEETV